MTDKKRSQILIAAGKILQTAKDPFNDVRPSTVAELSGVSQSLIYYHFPEMSELIGRAAVHLKQSQVELEKTALALLQDDPALTLQTWSRLRSKWAEENQYPCAILVFPNMLRLDRISSWRHTSDACRELLTPHLVSEYGLTVKRAQTLATAVDNLSMLPLELRESIQLLNLTSKTTVETTSYARAMSAILVGLR